MIPAKKSRWFNAWFARHARGRIRSTFGRVLVTGLDDARRVVEEAPALFVVNHTTWWDALVVLYLSELVLGCDGYALMDAANLRRAPFFRRVGAFGVDLDDPADGARSIRHAARLLDAPRRALWVFPEGRERSPFAPLELRPGSAQIARVARRAAVIPVGLRYIFGGVEQPELWIALGAPLPAERDVDRGLVLQRDGITRELARIDAVTRDGTRARELPRGDAVTRDGERGGEAPERFAVLHERSPSVLGRLAERVLGAAFGG